MTSEDFSLLPGLEYVEEFSQDLEDDYEEEVN
jgi:hypothetical protein